MTRLAALLCLATVLSACGNKGPLVMPSPAPAAAPVVVPPAEPSAEEPAAAEPAKTESGTPAR